MFMKEEDVSGKSSSNYLGQCSFPPQRTSCKAGLCGKHRATSVPTETLSRDINKSFLPLDLMDLQNGDNYWYVDQCSSQEIVLKI